jgi:hypothetical protein
MLWKGGDKYSPTHTHTACRAVGEHSPLSHQCRHAVWGRLVNDQLAIWRFLAATQFSGKEPTDSATLRMGDARFATALTTAPARPVRA